MSTDYPNWIPQDNEPWDDLEPLPTKSNFELSCPNDNQVFVVDEETLFRMDPSWRCYCGVRYEIREIHNA